MSSFPFYLIQRGSVNHDILITPETRLDDFVRWDYMGSAEFEFGALGKSLVRILHRFDEYKCLPTELFSADGKRICVFTRDESIPRKICDFADRPNPGYFDTKDPSWLEKVRKINAYAEEYRQLSLWFCIDNSTAHTCFNNGDWIAMFVNDIPAFLKVMENEKKAWDSYSENERKVFLQQSRFYD